MLDLSNKVTWLHHRVCLTLTISDKKQQRDDGGSDATIPPPPPAAAFTKFHFVLALHSKSIAADFNFESSTLLLNNEELQRSPLLSCTVLIIRIHCTDFSCVLRGSYMMGTPAVVKRFILHTRLW